MGIYGCQHSLICSLKIQALCALYFVYVILQFKKSDVGAGMVLSSESTANSADLLFCQHGKAPVLGAAASSADFLLPLALTLSVY